MKPRTYHLTETTTATPRQVLDAITDFGPGREQVFGNSADQFLEVHDLGDTYADVTEGTGKGDKPVSWERLRYDWSDPSRVTMKVLDSNVFSSDSSHTSHRAAQCGLLNGAPKRTRTSTRLSRTRPSTG